jgi:hypothetical protein
MNALSSMTSSTSTMVDPASMASMQSWRPSAPVSGHSVLGYSTVVGAASVGVVVSPAPAMASAIARTGIARAGPVRSIVRMRVTSRAASL